MFDWKKIESKFNEELNGKINWLSSEFSKLRTGRANPSVLDSVKVESFGVFVPLKKVANIQVTDARQLTVRPYDKSDLNSIVSSITKTLISINPVVDADLIRINFPQLTEETRKQMVKNAKSFCENAKVQVRNIRQDLFKIIKLDKSLQEDDYKFYEEKLNKLIKDANVKLEKLLSDKENEIMKI